MSQNRLRVTSPAGEKLISELKEIEKRVSDSGRESFDVGSGQGHHGDLVFALGMAVTDSVLYVETIGAVRDMRQLIADIQENPRRYFSFSIF